MPTDYFSQSLPVQGPGNRTIDVPIADIDNIYRTFSSISISYGTQIGASIIMLVVMLLMTPSTRIFKVNAIVQAIALLLNIIRMVLLSLYFTSNWASFLATFTYDMSRITSNDYGVSVASTVFSSLTIIAVEVELVLQAVTMMRLWVSPAKYTTSIVSVLLSLAGIGFRLAVTVDQIQSILAEKMAHLWINKASVTIGAVTIFWYCALFNVPLVMNLYQRRRFMPSAAIITPMEILVVANGFLMLIPGIFASIQWSNIANFESASHTYTAVTVVLPLGTLVAQRFSPKAASFNGSPGLSTIGSSGKPRVYHGSNRVSTPNSSSNPILDGMGGTVSCKIVSGNTRDDRASQYGGIRDCDKDDEKDLEANVVRVGHEVIRHSE